MRDAPPLRTEPSSAPPDPGERTHRVREAFVELLGSACVLPAPKTAWKVGSVAPAALLTPPSEEQVAACLRVATERGWSLVPAGAGSWLSGGTPVRRADVVLSVGRMDQIVQYEPGDLTLTAGAGLSLGGLDRLVSREGQWLPMDPPGNDVGTLGGTLATASAGGLATAYGAPRDLVLGVRLVTGVGRGLRLGGRVVKNVAGFDLVKLAVGSWGTLGVITEATFRLFPRPQQDICLVCRAERLEALLPGATRVARGRVMPASVQLLERMGTDDAGAREALLIVRLVGLDERVAREASIVESALGPLTPSRVDARAPEGTALLEQLRRVDDQCDVSLRLVGPVAELPDLLTVARSAGRLRPGKDELAGTPHRIAVDALRGSVTVGISRIRVDPPWAEHWAERIRALRTNVEYRDGSLTAHGHEAVIAQAGAWGQVGGALRLMKGLEAQFDPGGILSPGRLFSEEADRAGVDGV
jgi:glycolate oxidase FAD binding subunit